MWAEGGSPKAHPCFSRHQAYPSPRASLPSLRQATDARQEENFLVTFLQRPRAEKENINTFQ